MVERTVMYVVNSWVLEIGPLSAGLTATEILFTTLTTGWLSCNLRHRQRILDIVSSIPYCQLHTAYLVALPHDDSC